MTDAPLPEKYTIKIETILADVKRRRTVEWIGHQGNVETVSNQAVEERQKGEMSGLFMDVNLSVSDTSTMPNLSVYNASMSVEERSSAPDLSIHNEDYSSDNEEDFDDDEVEFDNEDDFDNYENDFDNNHDGVGDDNDSYNIDAGDNTDEKNLQSNKDKEDPSIKKFVHWLTTSPNFKGLRESKQHGRQAYKIWQAVSPTLQISELFDMTNVYKWLDDFLQTKAPGTGKSYLSSLVMFTEFLMSKKMVKRVTIALTFKEDVKMLIRKLKKKCRIRQTILQTKEIGKFCE